MTGRTDDRRAREEFPGHSERIVYFTAQSCSFASLGAGIQNSSKGSFRTRTRTKGAGTTAFLRRRLSHRLVRSTSTCRSRGKEVPASQSWRKWSKGFSSHHSCGVHHSLKHRNQGEHKDRRGKEESGCLGRNEPVIFETIPHSGSADVLHSHRIQVLCRDSRSFTFSRISGPNCETLPAPKVRIMSPSSATAATALTASANELAYCPLLPPFSRLVSARASPLMPSIAFPLAA